MSVQSSALPTHKGLEWFTGAGLGIFVHWDHASQQGVEISWPVVGKSIIPGVDDAEDPMTPEQYYSSAATFNPTNWDAREVARLARRAGATYVVFTAKHTAGYCMFHTQYTDFSIEHSPFTRDVTLELVEALRAEGIRVGIYFTLPDWHHPDYPAFQLSDRPYPREHYPEADLPENADSPLRLDRHRRPEPAGWQRYLADLRGELTEILTNYGQIDLLWFDGEWERSAQEWDTKGIHDLIRSIQPDVVINERLLEQGDYVSPEQALPVEAPDGPWELCLTIGQMWAYRPGDTKVKSARALARTLSEVTSRGGNLLLNIGPKGDGSLQPLQVDRLTEIGEWLDHHAEAVIGVQAGTGVDFYGPVTRRGDTVYLHLHAHPVEELLARGLPVGRVAGVRLLANAAALPYEVFYEVHVQTSDGAEPHGEIRIAAPEASGALLDIIAIDFTPREPLRPGIQG